MRSKPLQHPLFSPVSAGTHRDGASDAACDCGVQSTAQRTDNKDPIWIMLLISLGTGPFSVGACPWSLCTTAKDKHTLDTGPVIHHRTGRKGTRRPRQMCLFFLSFHLPWLDISSCGESQRPSQENKVMPALTDYTVPSVKGAIEGRSENPASAWAAGNPLSAVALARRTITNVLVHETKKALDCTICQSDPALSLPVLVFHFAR